MVAHTLSKQDRITQNRDFLRLKKKGKKHVSQHLLYVTCPNDHEQARFGCIVTRKTGNAVIRNQWKRKLREFFRTHKHELAQGTDHLWIVKSSTQGTPPLTLQTELSRLITSKTSHR